MKKDVKTEKQKNVFTALKKKTVRNKGMSQPPPPMSQAGNNTKLSEHAEAVAVNPAKIKRTARVSTYITDEANDTLEMLIIKLRRKEGKKPTIGEVLERAILELDKTL